MKRTIWRILLLVGLACFAAACQTPNNDNQENENAAATPTAELISAETPQPDSTLPAPTVTVDNIRVLVLQSEPVQVDVTITGSLPDGCSVLEPITQERQTTTFVITLTAIRDPNTPCTELTVPFSQAVPLNIEGLLDGVYTVQAGDKSETFTFGTGVTAPLEGSVGGGSITGFVWHDYCDIQADGSPTAGCVDAGDGNYRGDGLLAADESHIISVEITLSAGACPGDGTPASDLLVTTTRTDGTGSYLFGGLPAGQHCVSINAFSDLNIGILPPGVWTFPRVAEVSINSTVELAANEVRTDVNFGWDYQLGAVEVTNCTNKVSYVADVSIPDNTILSPGQEFVKTWRLRNDGDCTWTTAYALEFVEGDAMGFTGSQPLTTPVSPGQEAEISVTLTAPSAPGTYRSDWQLSDERGNFFGLGANADVSFYVQVVVQ